MIINCHSDILYLKKVGYIVLSFDTSTYIPIILVFIPMECFPGDLSLDEAEAKSRPTLISLTWCGRGAVTMTY